MSSTSTSSSSTQTLSTQQEQESIGSRLQLVTSSSVSNPTTTSTSKGVHFDESCIIIPQRRIRKTSRVGVVVGSSTIKVPIPSFLRSKSTSPVIPATSPVPPCLVHRSSEPSPSPTQPQKRTRPAPTPLVLARPQLTLSSTNNVLVPPPSPSALPSPTSPSFSSFLSRSPSFTHHHSQTPIIPVTTPLRPCCEACVSVTDASAEKGESWIIVFSKGAKIRRNADKEEGGGRGVSTEIIRVDEVESRRRSSTSSISSGSASSCSTVRPVVITSPLPEPVIEDDEELFPLPSPRRSPSVTSSGENSPASSVIFSNEDGILGQSLSRKKRDRCVDGYLCAPSDEHIQQYGEKKRAVSAPEMTLPSPPTSPPRKEKMPFMDDPNLPPPIVFSSPFAYPSADSSTVLSPAPPSLQRASTISSSPSSAAVPMSPPASTEKRQRPRRRNSLLIGRQAIMGAAAGMLKGFSGAAGSL